LKYKGVIVKTVDEMIADIIRREGGFSNHPNDRGKATKYGITLETLSNWRGRPTGIENVKRLTKTEAADIYRAEYFARPNINLLPTQLQPVVFDMAVNMGSISAIKILQAALGIKQDGIIGPVTAKEANIDLELAGETIMLLRITDLRVRYYKNIVERDPSQAVFLSGWVNRAREFLA
jgi:lysozyme family protein